MSISLTHIFFLWYPWVQSKNIWGYRLPFFSCLPNTFLRGSGLDCSRAILRPESPSLVKDSMLWRAWQRAKSCWKISYPSSLKNGSRCSPQDSVVFHCIFFLVLGKEIELSFSSRAIRATPHHYRVWLFDRLAGEIFIVVVLVMGLSHSTWPLLDNTKHGFITKYGFAPLLWGPVFIKLGKIVLFLHGVCNERLLGLVVGRQPEIILQPLLDCLFWGFSQKMLFSLIQKQWDVASTLYTSLFISLSEVVFLGNMGISLRGLTDCHNCL